MLIPDQTVMVVDDSWNTLSFDHQLSCSCAIMHCHRLSSTIIIFIIVYDILMARMEMVRYACTSVAAVRVAAGLHCLLNTSTCCWTFIFVLIKACQRINWSCTSNYFQNKWGKGHELHTLQSILQWGFSSAVAMWHPSQCNRPVAAICLRCFRARSSYKMAHNWSMKQ